MIASTRLVGMINSAAVAIEVAIVVVLVVALSVVVVFTGSGCVDNLTSRGIAAGAPNYFAFGGGLMTGMIVGLATLVGLRLRGEHGRGSQGPVSHRPARDRGIGGRGGGAGLLFLIALTVAIKDIPAVSGSELAGGGDHARSARTGRRDESAGRDQRSPCSAPGW